MRTALIKIIAKIKREKPLCSTKFRSLILVSPLSPILHPIKPYFSLIFYIVFMSNSQLKNKGQALELMPISGHRHTIVDKLSIHLTSVYLHKSSTTIVKA